MSLVVETRWMTGSILRSTYSERGMNQNDEEPCSNQHSYAVWNPNAGIWLHTRCHIVNHRVYPNIRQFWRTFGSSYGIALVSTWWYQMILRTGPEMGKRHDFPVWRFDFRRRPPGTQRIKSSRPGSGETPPKQKQCLVCLVVEKRFFMIC
jgi:hypothetical protein